MRVDHIGLEAIQNAVHHLHVFLDGVAQRGRDKEHEQVGILAAGKRSLGADGHGDLLIAHHLFVENPGAPAGQQAAHHIEGGVVLVVLIGALVGDERQRLAGRFNLGLLGDLPGAARLCAPAAAGRGGQPSEIPLSERASLLGIDVAHDRDGDIRRRVIGAIKRFGVFHAQAGDVARPSARHALVGVGFERRGQQGLHQLALRAGFDAHAALLQHHVALFVELAEHGMQEALRLQQKPQLGAVGGQVVEILGRVELGAGVETYAAILFDDGRIQIGNNEGIGFLDGGFQLIFERLQFGLIGVEALALFAFQAVVDLLDVSQRLFSLPASWWSRSRACP